MSISSLDRVEWNLSPIVTPQFPYPKLAWIMGILCLRKPDLCLLLKTCKTQGLNPTPSLSLSLSLSKDCSEMLSCCSRQGSIREFFFLLSARTDQRVFFLLLLSARTDPRVFFLLSTRTDPRGFTLLSARTDPRGLALLSARTDPRGLTLLSARTDPRGFHLALG